MGIHKTADEDTLMIISDVQMVFKIWMYVYDAWYGYQRFYHILRRIPAHLG